VILRRGEDWRSVATVAASVAVMVLEWTGIARHPLLWLLELGLVYQLYLINHNHQHLPVFRWMPLNRCFDLLITLASGLPASVLIPLHNRNHHEQRNGPDDYMATARLRWRNPLARLLVYPIAAAVAYAPRKRVVLATLAIEEPSVYRRLLAQRVALAMATAALIALQPMATLTYIIAPWVIGQYWMINANYLQHDGCDHGADGRHARDITGGVINWLLFNGGYHRVHHERPAVHWADLPREHATHSARLSSDLQFRTFSGLLWWVARGRHRTVP
jgi:beta-carotene hydroxylase